MSWKKVKLAELLQQIKIIVQIDNSKEYKLVTVSSKGTIKQREVVKGFEIKGEKAFEAKKGRFIYSRLSVHNGAFGIVPIELEGALLTSEMPIFDINDRILPEFLIYSLQLPTFKFQLEQLTKGVGRTRVKEANFLSLLIDLPSIEDQKEIVNSFIIYEEKSSNISTELTNQLTLVKKLRQQFLQDAVQGKLVEQPRSLSGKKDEPASELLKKIKAEKEKLIAEKKLKKEKELPPIKLEEIAFEIPENWVWCRMGEIVSLITSGSRNWNKYYSKEGDLFIRSQNIKPTQIDLTNQAFVKLPNSTEGKRTAVEKYDILITITGAGVSNAGLLTEMFFDEGYISQHVALVRLMMKEIAYWIHFCIISDCIGKSQFSKMIYGDKPGLNLVQLNSLIIPLPPIAEQNRIVQKLDELMQYCNELETSIKQSESQNSTLLQQVLREALRPVPLSAGKEPVEV